MSGRNGDAPASDRDDFRRVLGQFATGVTVLTARDGDQVHGITANSFTSVSLAPPLVLVCIDKGGRFDRILQSSRRYCVNVLGENDEAISNRFARRREGSRTDFDDCSVETTADGVPIIAGCLAHLECRVVDIHEAGDHRIFVGAVERCRANADAKALIFFRGRYRSLTPWMRTPLADPSHLDYPLCSL